MPIQTDVYDSLLAKDVSDKEAVKLAEAERQGAEDYLNQFKEDDFLGIPVGDTRLAVKMGLNVGRSLAGGVNRALGAVGLGSNELEEGLGTVHEIISAAERMKQSGQMATDWRTDFAETALAQQLLWHLAAV